MNGSGAARCGGGKDVRGVSLRSKKLKSIRYINEYAKIFNGLESAGDLREGLDRFFSSNVGFERFPRPRIQQ